MKWLTLAIFVSITAIAGAARADDVTVNAELDRTAASVGNEVTLTVTVQGKFRRSAEPELPPLADFDVYNGGTSQNFSMINGRIQSSISYRYVIVPKTEGRFEIGPVKVVIADKEYATRPIELEVTAAAASIQRQIPSPGSRSQGSLPGSGGDEDRSIFIEAAIDRDTVYVNQQITWTLGYYTDGRVNLLRSPNYSPPEAEGFWVEDLPPQNKYYVTLDNRKFLVNEIKRAYFPTSPGLFVIGPASVDVVLDDLSTNKLDDFFSRNFRSRGFGKAQTLRTRAREIAVLPLPGRGKPPGFGGVVAEGLTLSMYADKQVVQVGEPVNLTVVMNGRGNMKTVAPPALDGMEAFKVYESGSHSDVFKKSYIVSGRKKYDYVVVPREQGKLTIPAVELPYFDPVKKKYLVASSHPVHLDVQPGTQEEGRKIIYAGTGDDFEVISQDIRFIHPVPSAMTATAGIGDVRWLLAVHALPLLALAASVLVERRRRRFRSDVGLARSSRALREADRKLDAARKSFRAGHSEDGFAGVSGAVTGYFADKMNVAAAGLTVDIVSEFLGRRGVDDETAAAVSSVLGDCDAARFASGAATGGQGEELAGRAGDVIRSLEKEHLR